MIISLNSQLKPAQHQYGKLLYDYSRSEKSIGNEIDGQIINTSFRVIEKIKGEVKKNYEIPLKLIKIMPYQVVVKSLK